MTATSLPTTALIWPQALPTTPLPRFFLLAALLHVWLVLMLGNAPGGTAREGQGVFGSLNITLQGAPSGPVGQALPPQLPATPTGARGDAEQQRYGGAVRTALPTDLQRPGAAQLGDWSPVQGGVPDGQTAVAAPAPTPDPTPAPAQAAPLPPPAAATAPSTFGSSSQVGLQRSLNPVAPAMRSAQDAVNGAPMPRVPPASWVAAPALLTVPAAPAAAVAGPMKQVPAALPTAQAAPEAALPRPTPAAAVVATVPVLAAVPQPTAPLPAASVERQLASRLPSERSAPGVALPDVGRASTAPLHTAVPAPVGRPAAAAAALAAGAAPPVANAAANPVATPPNAAPAAPLVEAPAASLAPIAASGFASSGPQPALAAPPTAGAALSTTPLQDLPKPGPPLPNVPASAGQGAPDAGSRRGSDVATLPSTPANGPKRLNLELPRLRGGELSRYSTTGVLPALPRPPEVPDKLGSAIEKTAKEDCRKAYAGAGLLAVVPLAVDALREGGCKW